jgi:TetR/AcrR family transcriptional repressor of mexJK operon
MAPSPAPHRPGRPKDNAKREAIIDAARALFASQPFDLVTMETVAARARVSKMTVYSHFHDKETLFETIVTATAEQMISALSEPDLGGGLRERLIAVGTSFLDVILGSDICDMAHTLPGTLRANQDLANRFYAAGPGRVRAALSSIIAAGADQGELSVDDPKCAADDLVSLWERASREDRVRHQGSEYAGGTQAAGAAGHGCLFARVSNSKRRRPLSRHGTATVIRAEKGEGDSR